MKRTFDFSVALVGLLVLAPLLTLIALAVWLEDFRFPFFLGWRVGRGGRDFRMVKLRTMTPDAWKSGVSSTAADDARVTRTGKWLRRRKLDELPQLVNVLMGDMSLVGPRPQVPADAALYTGEERILLTARPGMTDLASIVFADEAAILAGSEDPDLRYNQVIRPWKSRLALLYLQKPALREMQLDLHILMLTAVALISHRQALAGVGRILDQWDAEEMVRRMARRTEPLVPYPPPGAQEIMHA